MGFFSWKTNDTDRSIANTFAYYPEVFTVYLVDDKGNKWREDDYEGYGVFGGKDYYELLAEMNGLRGDRDGGLRDGGLHLVFSSGRKDLKYPNLVENPDWEWVNQEPENCEYQGYFYEDMSEDE